MPTDTYILTGLEEVGYVKGERAVTARSKSPVAVGRGASVGAGAVRAGGRAGVWMGRSSAAAPAASRSAGGAAHADRRRAGEGSRPSRRRGESGRHQIRLRGALAPVHAWAATRRGQRRRVRASRRATARRT
ncbi:unnamed protein product [Parajaminaea phylloscopi]